MSDNLQMMQGSSSRSTQPQAQHTQRRPDKQASSCTECRRRKQKCSQGNPCTNCARRFPQPICDYGTKTKSRRTAQRDISAQAAKDISKEGPYSHLSLAGVQDAILQIEKPHENEPRASNTNWYLGWQHMPSSPSPPPSPSNQLAHHAAEHMYPGEFKDWLPFRLVVRDRKGNASRKSLATALRALMDRRMDENDLGPDDDWMLDAARLIWAAQGSYQPSSSPSRLDDQLRYLPMVPSKLNKELVRTHLRLLSKFKASVSGMPEPDNPLMQHWVPFIIQDPLLLQIVLFTSACFLNETGHLPKAVVVALRGLVYQALNENLRNGSSQTSDAAIHAVSEMILDEWYWGSTQELHAHMAGLKTMIRMRGGLQDLGLHGFISKMILIQDICIAVSHETEPEIYGHPGFEYTDPIQVPFQLSLNCPFTSGLPTFASSAASLNLHLHGAIILDHMRSVYEAVFALPEYPSSEQLGQVTGLATWILCKIQDLPESVFVQHGPISRGSPEEILSESSSPTNSNDSGSPNDRSTSASSSSPTNVVARQRSQAQVTGQVMSPNKGEVFDRHQADAPDFLYMLIRKTAMAYCRAIAARQPTSQILTTAEVMQLWGLFWKVSMGRRRSIVGILYWSQLLLAPSCHNLAPARFIKTMVVNGLMTIAVENWHFAIDTGEASLRLQRWLKGPNAVAQPMRRVVFGGEHAIALHGFAQKEVLRNISTIHKGGGEDDDDSDGDADVVI